MDMLLLFEKKSVFQTVYIFSFVRDWRSWLVELYVSHVCVLQNSVEIKLSQRAQERLINV